MTIWMVYKNRIQMRMKIAIQKATIEMTEMQEEDKERKTKEILSVRMILSHQMMMLLMIAITYQTKGEREVETAGQHQHEEGRRMEAHRILEGEADQHQEIFEEEGRDTTTMTMTTTTMTTTSTTSSPLKTTRPKSEGDLGIEKVDEEARREAGATVMMTTMKETETSRRLSRRRLQNCRRNSASSTSKHSDSHSKRSATCSRAWTSTSRGRSSKRKKTRTKKERKKGKREKDCRTNKEK